MLGDKDQVECSNVHQQGENTHKITLPQGRKVQENPGSVNIRTAESVFKEVCAASLEMAVIRVEYNSGQCFINYLFSCRMLLPGSCHWKKNNPTEQLIGTRELLTRNVGNIHISRNQWENQVGTYELL